MQDYQERIQMDRYAIKNPDAQPKVGDTAVVSMKRKFQQDGELTESRELGVITRVWTSSEGTENEYSLAIRESKKPKESWEIIDHVNRNSIDVLVETSYSDICKRVANGIIKLEPENTEFSDLVYSALVKEEFVPAGRILAGVGRSELNLTLFNCYVFPPPHDSRGGIMDSLRLLFDTFSVGGGCGMDWSSLRPRGSVVRQVSGRSSGAVSWIDLSSQLTGKVEQGGSRRGAELAGLWVWHPDIIEFIEAKSLRTEFTTEDGKKVSRNKELLENANVSVLISDRFMEAVKSDANWDLVFPDRADPAYDSTWRGDLDAWLANGGKIIVYKRVKAKWLWDLIIKKAWESGEPGILFLDRANKMSNSYYYAKLVCTNPCGEIPLPSFGICNLGHIHLAKFLRTDAEQFPDGEVDSETAIKKIDWDRFRRVINIAVRFLDNATDINRYHLSEIEIQQKSERRTGLGILGYAEMLVRLGLRYGSPEAEKFTHYLFRRFSKYSYLASVNLAKERGAFPKFDCDKFLASGFMKIHDEEVIEAVRQHGIRNVTLNTAAPTGSVGAMLNTTTGIEPYFLAEWTARSRIGSAEEEASVLAELRKKFGKTPPSYFVTTDTVTPEEHVRTQAAVQRWIDASIAKTVNMPNSATVEDVSRVYTMMYDLGCKGGTVYRDRSRDRQVLYHKGTEPKIPVKIVDEYMGDDVTPDAEVIRPRIKAGLGVILSQKTPTGWVHGTIRMHPQTGEPYDLFLSSGKGDIAADVQAIGRLISVILRWPNHTYIGQATRLEIVRNQLFRIPGGQQEGYGPTATISMPDGIAQLLHQYLAGAFPLAMIPLGVRPMEQYIEDVADDADAKDSLRLLLAQPTLKEAEGPVAVDDAPDFIEKLIESDRQSSQPMEQCPECKQISLLRQIGHCPHCVVCGLKLC
jgi:ribonucleoside-diphosphate reductase alpha chain